MRISMWNLFEHLPYEEKTAMIREGLPVIRRCLALGPAPEIGPGQPSDHTDDTVLVGMRQEYFDEPSDDTIIVNKYDMIFVSGADQMEVFNSVIGIIESYNQWDERLLGCMNSTRGLQEMLDISMQALGYPTIVFSPILETLAVLDPDESRVQLPGKVPGKVPGGLQGQDVQEQEDILEGSQLPGDRKRDWELIKETVYAGHEPAYFDPFIGETETFTYLRSDIFYHGQLMACLVSILPAGSRNQISRSRIYETAHLTERMTGYMAAHYDRYNLSARYLHFLTSLLQHQYVSGDEIQQFLTLRRWDSMDQYRIIALEYISETDPGIPDHGGSNPNGSDYPGSDRAGKGYAGRARDPVMRLYRRCLESYPTAAVLILDQRVVLLLRSRDLNFNIEKFERLYIPEFRCGISNDFQGLEHAWIYYLQARRQLQACLRQGIFTSHASEGSLSYYQNQLNQNILTYAYISRPLLQLRQYDDLHQTDYYHTAKAYILSFFHPADAASMLGIHRNSLAYRLDKIRQITDFSDIDNLAARPDPGRIEELVISCTMIDAQRVE